MKKQITVKRKHRYTNERDVVYQGLSDFEKQTSGIKLQYQEINNEATVQVEVFAYQDHMEIKRMGETSSHLLFAQGKKTKGVLTSPYGDIDIDFYTHRYICRDNVITLEYDIYHGSEISGGYRMIWNIKEGQYE